MGLAQKVAPKPLRYSLFQPQMTYVLDPKTGEYIEQKKIFQDYLKNYPARLSVMEFLEAKAAEEKAQRFRDRLKTPEQQKEVQPFMDSLKMRFGLGVKSETFFRMFGGDEVVVQPQGLAELSLGAASTTLRNPSIPKENQTQTLFDFNFKTNLNLLGEVGTKLKLKVNYSTESNFDFQNDLKIEYTGHKDEIIQKIELGNIGMRIPSQLIKGAENLFGGKVITQFGPLTSTVLVAAQKSELKSIQIKKGGIFQQKDILASDYQNDRFFYFSLFFRENYDQDMKLLPILPPGAKLIKAEVWLTNSIQKTENSRSAVAFTDLGENPSEDLSKNDPYKRYTYRPFVNVPAGASDWPDNQNNALYNSLKNNIRNFASLKSILEQPQSFLQGSLAMVEGEDFERIENARLLTSSDYQINERLGFISLSQKLKPNDILAIAYQYTDAQGIIHQVGEFAADLPDMRQTLILKTLKGTYLDPKLTLFHLMMKNVYSLGAFRLSLEDFRLLFLYRNAQTGIDVNFLPTDGLRAQLLLQVLGFDLLNSMGTNFPDGEYDLVDAATQKPGTLDSEKGLLFLPTVEPFGQRLEDNIKQILQGFPIATVQNIIDQFVFKELYTQVPIAALDYPQKNQFRLRALYKSEMGSEIFLDANNIPRGAVRVRIGNLILVENVDYAVNYALGSVRILNESLLSGGQPIVIDFESNGFFSMQQKKMFGLHLDYKVMQDMRLGFTYMYASEQPFNAKPIVGAEAYSNHILGTQFQVQKETPFLTRWAEFLPFVYTREPSFMSAQIEAAYLIPTTLKYLGNQGCAYIDDFESSQGVIDLKQPSFWKIASVPQKLFQSNAPNTDYNVSPVIQTNKNRALLSWYVIDPIFNGEFKETPAYLSNNLSEQGAIYQREIFSDEIYPNKQYQEEGDIKIPTFDLAYYPNERGMYNFDPNALQADGTLKDPQNRWAGIMRALPITNFSQGNVEYIQFLVMNPYEQEASDRGHAGSGRMRIQLGEISEEILKNSGSFNEAALPSTAEAALSTADLLDWGRKNNKTPLVYQFADQQEGRFYQDAGGDGILNTVEQYHYQNYLQAIQGILTNPTALQKILNDPSGDDYVAALDGRYDDLQASILNRYKYVNGLEGNASSKNPATLAPDGNDLNGDYNTNLVEKYIETAIEINPTNFQMGADPHIISEIDVDLSGKKATAPRVKWFSVRIPISEFKGGSATDLNNIRFMRIIFDQFDAPIVLRFAQLELLTSDWRLYQKPLDISPTSNAKLQIGAVNLEEHFSRQPVAYVMPPGVERQIQYFGNKAVADNEQSLELKIENLAQNEAKAVFKNLELNLLSYGNIKMFAHVEPLTGSNLQNDQIELFLRLGSDINDNYYEYRMPLEVTNIGTGFVQDPYLIWPEKNQIDLAISDLQKLKLERNQKQFSLLNPYEKKQNGKSLFIKGNPNLQSIKNLVIGVQNKNTPASMAVWVNELRSCEFYNPNAGAILASGQIKMADLLNVQAGTSFKSTGFGDLQSRVSERQRESTTSFDFNSTLEMGKFFGNRIQVRMPLFFGYQYRQSIPEFDPQLGDVSFAQYGDFFGKEQMKKQRKKATSSGEIYSVNLTNVGIAPIFEHPKIYEPANFSISYAYTQERVADLLLEEEFSFSHQAAFTYNFSQNTPFWKLFGKIKKQNVFTDFLKEIQLGYAPELLYFSSQWRRNYFQRKDEPLFGNESPYRFEKKLLWDRIYKYTHSLGKRLRLSFNAINQSLVLEPYVLADKKINPQGFADTEKALWNNLKTLGENLQYDQNVEIDYSLPLDAFKPLSFIKAGITYKGKYSWKRAPLRFYQPYLSPSITGNYQNGDLIDPKDDIGNSIQNRRDLSFITQWDFQPLYMGNKRIKEAERRLRGFGNNKNEDKKAKFSDYLIRFGTMIRRMEFEYTFADATNIEGYNQKSAFLGMNGQLKSPSFLFLWGHQDKNIFLPLEGKDPQVVLDLAQNGFIVERKYALPYLLKHENEFKFKLNAEPLLNLFFELSLGQRRIQSQSGLLAYQNNDFSIKGKTMNGYFQTSFLSIGTSFNANKAFSDFLNNRSGIAKLLAQKYNAPPDPNQPGFYEGFSPTHPEVLLHAFVNTYGARKNNYKDIFSIFPIPNWRISYNGLANFSFFKKWAKFISISHQYSSQLVLGQFSTLQRLQAGEKDLLGNIWVYDKNELAKQYNTVEIAEKFNPFLDLYIDLLLNIQIKFGINLDRTLQLNFLNQQLSEQKGIQYFGSIGYRYNKLSFLFLKKRYPVELLIRCDIAWKQTQTLIRRLLENDQQLTVGGNLFNFRFNTEYTINQWIGFVLYAEHTFNQPFSSVQFPVYNTRAGVTIRLFLQ